MFLLKSIKITYEILKNKNNYKTFFLISSYKINFKRH